MTWLFRRITNRCRGLPTISVLVATLVAASALLAGDTQLSGAAWVKKFPGSVSVDDLDPAFGANVKAFMKAAGDAGAKIAVTSTLRPKERAYLMHWSWQIAKMNQDAMKVPAMNGVNINWWHGSQDISKQKAQEMVAAYGIDGLKVSPALSSRHTEGKAIDMQITWNNTLTIKNKTGTSVTVDTTPRDSTNAKLIEVGATYGVIHFTDVPKDEVHWSTDGK